MAVTYEQFLNALNGSKWKNEWSASDLELAKKHPEFGMTVLSYKEDWHNASTPEQRAVANEGAEYARKTWGNYTGGGDGSGYYSLGPRHQAADDALEKLGTYAPYRYSREGEYQSALTGAVRPEPFRYDPETDPVYASYRKTYTREGRRAGEDTLGQYSALTGGRPSTAAVTASQQAGNYYAAKLADKVPELYRDAYDRYLREYEQKLNSVKLLGQDDDREYGRYRDDYSRQTDLYGLLRRQENEERSRQDAEDAARYSREQDAWKRSRAEEQTAYDREQDAYAREQAALNRARQAMLDAADREDTAYSHALDRAKLGASVGDYSGLLGLGIDPDLNALLRTSLASKGRTVPVGSGYGSSAGSRAGTGSRTGGESPEDTGSKTVSVPTSSTVNRALEAFARDPENEAARNILIAAGYLSAPAPQGELSPEELPTAAPAESENYRNMAEVMERMVGYGRTPGDRLNELEIELRVGGLTQEEYAALKSKYVDAFLAAPDFFSSRSEARDWLISAGVPREIAGRVPDEAEWAREREDPRKDAYGYEGYGAFLADYAKYLLEQYGE